MARPQILGEELVNEVVRRVLDHLDLFEDDLLFATDVVGAERRVHDDVGEHLDGQRQVLIEDFEVVARVLLRREGIHLSADGIDGLSDVLGGPRRGSLEQHVLDEVSDAALLLCLVTRAREPARRRC